MMDGKKFRTTSALPDSKQAIEAASWLPAADCHHGRVYAQEAWRVAGDT